jgi:hypothetical protein
MRRAPATIENEGLADVEAPNPFRLPDFTQESGCAYIVGSEHTTINGHHTDGTMCSLTPSPHAGYRRR